MSLRLRLAIICGPPARGAGVALMLGFVGGVMLAVSLFELLPAGLTLVRQSMRHTAPVPA